MGLVPLISGLGLTIIPLTVREPNPALLVFLSLFAACITLGLFRWELWNIKKCRLLIAFAQKLQQKVQEQYELKSIRTASRPQGIGKREAEKFIYSVIVLAWLVFPGLFLSSVQFDTRLWMIHLPLAAVIIFATIISLFGSTEPKSEAQTKNDDQP